MTPPAPKPSGLKMSGMSWFARFLYLAVLLLAGLALPQQAAAQENTTTFGPFTYTISDAEAVDEGGTARFMITEASGVAFVLQNVEVRYSFGSAELSDLGSDRPTTYNNVDARTTQILEVPIADDDIAEGEETFTVTIGFVPNSDFFTFSATGTINASDRAAPQITTQPTDQTVTTGEDATFTVAATGTPTPTYQWRFEGSDISGATSASYTISGAALTDAGDYTVVVTNTVSSVTSNAATLTVEPSTVNISIADPRRPRAEQRLSSSALSFPVTLSQELLEERTLNITYTPGTGESGASLDDLRSDRPTTLTLPTGTTTVDLNVFIFDDFADEADEETFTVTLSVPDPLPTNPANTLNITTATATGTIVDNDNPPQESGQFAGSTYTIADATGTEGGTARFILSIDPPTGPRSGGLLIGYAAGTAGLDDLGSTRPTRTGEILPNTRSIAIEVPINDDLEEEDEETFTVQIPINNVTIQATGTIIDNDGPPQITTQPTDQSVTAGEDATFTVAAIGTPTPTYQWRFEGSDISGATSASYTISGADADDAGDYTVVVTNSVGTVTSSAATLTVTPATPDLTVDDVSVSNASVVEGASFLINVTVNNGGNGASAATTLTYYRSTDATITTDDTSIATDPIGALAAGGSSTQNALVSIATADTYYVGACVPMVSGETDTDNNCSTGVQVTVTAPVAPEITTQPTDQTVTVGDDATFTVAATGTPAPTYQWRRDGTAISGATSASYTVSGADADDAGEYTVVVTNSAGTVTSNAATLTVTPVPVAPEITTQPTDQSVTVGENATFTVTATGNPAPTYQWRFDGTDISGATSASYTITGADEDDAGDYTVVVTNTVSSVTSSAATLTVTAATPDLSVDGVSVSSASVVEGASFTINATVNNEGNAASAATTLTYYRSADDAITTDDTSMATDAVGALAAGGSSTQNASVSIATADTYYVGACVPTVIGETDTDNPITLINCSTGVQVTVTAPVAPEITTQPTDQSVTVGDDATFTVAATGSPTPTYQWRFEGSDISGATSASYTITGADEDDAGDYTVVVTNTAGTVTSSAATLTVTPVGPALTVDSVSVSSASVVEGTSFTINATVNNEGDAASAATTLTYYRSTDATITTDDTSMATDAVGALAASGSSTQDASVSIATAGTYYVGACVSTVRGETDTDNNCSTGVQVTVTAPVAPAITTQPVNQTVPDGENATFTVVATGSPPPTYQWRRDGTDISGATSASYTISDAMTPGSYTVVVTNRAGSVTSTAAELRVSAMAFAPQITTQPTDQSVPVGDDATFTVVAFGSPTSNYQWRFNGTAIAGATSASYTISSAVEDDAGDYTVVVTNRVGDVTSTAATLTVTPVPVAPQITTQPADQSVTVGENATFTVVATGSPTPTYQWRFDGSDISGATSASYTITSADEDDAGDYTVVVTNSVSSVTSTAATLTVTPATVAPQITTQPTDQSVTVGDNATFTVAATGTPTPTYQWRFDGTAISGATSASYTITSADEDDAGDYTVVVTNRAGNVTSTAATLTVTPAPVAPQITTQPTDQSVTVGEDATFTVAATGTPAPTYQWHFAGSAISGATSASYTITSADEDDAGDYTVVVTNTAASVTSTAATLTVAAATGDVIVSIDDAEVDEGDDSVTLTARFSRAVSQDVMLGITYQDGTATFADDLSGDPSPPRRVTIKANTLSADFTVFIRNDTIDEPDEETLTVTLGGASLPPGENFVFNGSHRGTLTIIDDDDPAPPVNNRVSIVDPQPISEGAGSLNFVVSTSFNVNNDVVLGVTYAGGTTNPATPADDLGADRPSMVTITEGERRATLSVPIADDDIIEGNEIFTVTLSLPAENPPGHILFLDANEGEATGTINEDDAAEVTLTANTATANENGGTFSYTVNLSAAADEAVTVRWTATDGTATVDDDLQETTNTVTFAANDDTAQTFTISPANDNEDEDNETFTVTLEVDGDNPLPTGVTIGTNNSSTATITDDDAPVEATVSIDNASVTEGRNAEFTVSLTTAVTSDVTLAVAYADGTASLADDLLGTPPATVMIDQGDTEATFVVPIRNDEIVEGDEDFTVTISEGTTPLPDGVTIGTDNTATGTISDNDAGEITLSPTEAGADEYLAFTYMVSLDAASDQDVTVRWTASIQSGNTASLGDLETTTDTVTFAAGDNTNQTFTIRPVDDDQVEVDETFTVTLGPDIDNPLPTGITIGSSNSSVATIYNDDTGQDNSFRSRRTTYTISDAAPVDEGTAARFTITVQSPPGVIPLAGRSDVAYSFGTADINDLGDDRPTSLRFNTTDTTYDLDVPIEDDDLAEGTETFTVRIGNSTTNMRATGTINASDGGGTPPADATVSIDDASVAENGGNAEFTVSLTTAVDSDVTLAVAYAAGTATLATDLGTRPDTVTIDANTTEATLLVPITNDNIVEGNEDFTVTISEGTTPLPEGVTIGTDNTATGTITNDDAAEVTLSPSTLEATEGNSFSYTVRLSAPADEAVNITWTASIETGDNADLAADLQTTTNTVTFAANDNADKTFTIATTQNTEDEPNKTFTVTLTPTSALPTGVTIPTATARSAATIADDDDPLPGDDTTVSIGNVSVAENVSDGNARFTVSLNRAVTSNVVLGVTYAAGVTNPATVADDLGNLSTTVTINRGDTEATLTVPIINDPIVEGNETFTVTIAVNTPPEAIAPQERVSIGNGVATGTIIDDDRGLVTLSPPTLTAAENGTFSYNVNLSAAADEAVTVRWTASAEAGDTATVADDLQEITGAVTFNADTNTNQTFTIRPADDDTDEPNETFTVTLTPTGTLPTGVTIPTATASSAATITDNDDPVPPPPPPPPPEDDTTVSIANVSVAENVPGGNARFTVTLSRAVTSPVVLDIAYTAGTADLEADLGTPLPPTVTIPANRTSATFDVPIIDDTIVEDNETFTVTITLNTAPTEVTITDGVATGMIDDNDTPPPPTGGGGRPADPVLISLSPPRATAPEDGVFTYTVNISEAADEAVNITWTASDGSATVADDLQEFTGTITFPADNATSQTFTIRPVDDLEVEGNETFTVTLTPTTTLPRDVEIDEDNAGSTATIMDNDEVVPPPVVNTSLNIDDVTVAEDVSGGNARFTVILGQAVTSDIVLNVAYAASGANPVTLADDLGTPRPTTVRIPANSASATIDVPIIDDDIVEGDETFTVTVSEGTTPLPAGVTIEDGEAVATIIDNDEAPPVSVTVSIADAAPVAEDAGPARFMVSLTEAVGSAVVLDITYVAGSASLADLGNSRPASVTIESDETSVAIDVPIIADDIAEGEETFTVTITGNNLPAGVTIANGSATGTIERSLGRPPVPSALIEPRRSGAGTALRRHVDRFDNMTGSVILNRLNTRQTRRLSGSENLGNGAMVVGGGLGETSWGAWVDVAWAGFDGTASGQQADLYGGVDYLDVDGNWVIGALIGFEAADLDIGDANYRSDYTHIGFYGGARLSERLLFDGAASYGTATPDIDIVLGNDSVSYDAQRFTVRGALTGDFGLEISLRGGSSVTVEPQIDLLYARERLGDFTDSAGGVAEREELELGRFSAGPRLTWDFEGGQVVGGVRMRGDFLQLGDGIEERVSGAANIGLQLNPRPNFTMGFQLDVDGIGITDDYTSFGGRIEFNIRF